MQMLFKSASFNEWSKRINFEVEFKEIVLKERQVNENLELKVKKKAILATL